MEFELMELATDTASLVLWREVKEVYIQDESLVRPPEKINEQINTSINLAHNLGKFMKLQFTSSIGSAILGWDNGNFLLGYGMESQSSLNPRRWPR
jgi:hypothetical protein